MHLIFLHDSLDIHKFLLLHKIIPLSFLILMGTLIDRTQLITHSAVEIQALQVEERIMLVAVRCTDSEEEKIVHDLLIQIRNLILQFLIKADSNEFLVPGWQAHN